MYQNILIRNPDGFSPSEFPQLEESLQQLEAQLAGMVEGPKTEMILSFVKDHSIRSQQVKDNPELAKLISSGSLPLQVMEALFEASRPHPMFRKQLEEYLKRYFTRQNL